MPNLKRLQLEEACATDHSGLQPMDVYSSSRRLELDIRTLFVLDAFLDRRTLEHLALLASSIPSENLAAIFERSPSLVNLSIVEEYFTNFFWRTDPASDPVYVVHCVTATDGVAPSPPSAEEIDGERHAALRRVGALAMSRVDPRLEYLAIYATEDPMLEDTEDDAMAQIE